MFVDKNGIGFSFFKPDFLEKMKQAKQGCSTICGERDCVYKFQFKGYVLFTLGTHSKEMSDRRGEILHSVQDCFLPIGKIRE